MTVHRSFRLTPPDYMRGKRVKPRLRVIVWIVSGTGIVLSTGAMLATVIVLPREWGTKSELFGGFVGLCAYFLLTQVCLRVLVQLNCITTTEVRDFPYSSYWRDSWLESTDDRSTSVADQRQDRC